LRYPFACVAWACVAVRVWEWPLQFELFRYAQRREPPAGSLRAIPRSPCPTSALEALLLSPEREKALAHATARSRSGDGHVGTGVGSRGAMRDSTGRCHCAATSCAGCLNRPDFLFLACLMAPLWFATSLIASKALSPWWLWTQHPRGTLVEYTKVRASGLSYLGSTKIERMRHGRHALCWWIASTRPD
jgi:hypothetical protein